MDIYFEEDYNKIYEKEEEKLEIFKYENEVGKGKSIFLKRKINTLIKGKQYYDLITPYGYGGPIFEVNQDNESNFKKEYFLKFDEYCKKNNIVSEFVRFHPLKKNYIGLDKEYNLINCSNTIYIDLESEEKIFENMSSKARNMIRKALKNNLVFEEDLNFKTIENFKKIYYETMKKNKASTMYYFDDDYFKNLLKLKNKVKLFNIKFNEEIISSTLILLGDKYLHYHLSGNTLLGYEKAANNFLLYKIALWGKDKGYQKFHLGGGYGGNDSSLYKFKEAMNRNGVLNFYIGKKIYNEAVYNLLVKSINLAEWEIDSNYFPLYRVKERE